MSREAMKLALEALKDPLAPTKRMKAITAIHEALAEQCVCGEPDTPGTHRTDGPCLAEQPAQQQEPVAHVLFRQDDDGLEPVMFYWPGTAPDPTTLKDKFTLRDVWLSPQPAQQWCFCEPTKCYGVGRCRWQAMNYSPLDKPAQQEPVAAAMGKVIEALQQDPEYAWSWHCNIAMAFVDAGGDHYTGNQGAARFMKLLANVEPAHELPSPQPSKPFVGLTDEEISQLWIGTSPYFNEDDFARAIEAKLREKNT